MAISVAAMKRSPFSFGVYSSQTVGNGIPFSSAQTRLLTVAGDDAGAACTGDIRVLIGRALLTVAHTGALSVCGVRGHLKIKAATAQGGGSGTFAGTSGLLETHSTSTFTLGFFCGVDGGISPGGTLTNTSGYVFGVMGRVVDGDAAVTVTDTAKAFAAFGAWGSATGFSAAMYVSKCGALLQFRAAADTYDHAIKVVAATPGGNTSHAIKILIDGTAGYIPVYAAENF